MKRTREVHSVSKGFKDRSWRTFTGEQGRGHLSPQPRTCTEGATAARPLRQRHGWDAQCMGNSLIQKTPRGFFSKQMELTAWGEPWQLMWVLAPSSLWHLGHPVWCLAHTRLILKWNLQLTSPDHQHLYLLHYYTWKVNQVSPDPQPKTEQPENRSTKKGQLKKTTHKDNLHDRRKLKVKAEFKQKTKNY